MHKFLLWFLAMALGGLTTSVFAQDRGAPKNLTLLGISSATVAPHGTVFLSFSGTTKRSDISNDPEGAFASGVGFGSAENGLGFQLTGHVTSLSRTFGGSGYFAVKAAKRVSQGGTPIYVGVSIENLLTWGDDTRNVDERRDAMISVFPQLTLGNGETYPLMLTFGVGADRRNSTDVGMFAGAGIGLSETVGVSAAWTGQDAAFGVAFRPRAMKDLHLTAVLEDAFDRQDERRLTISVNWIFKNVFGG